MAPKVLSSSFLAKSSPTAPDLSDSLDETLHSLPVDSLEFLDGVKNYLSVCYSFIFFFASLNKSAATSIARAVSSAISEIIFPSTSSLA